MQKVVDQGGHRGYLGKIKGIFLLLLICISSFSLPRTDIALYSLTTTTKRRNQYFSF